MSHHDYKAKKHYQSEAVVSHYDRERFESWYGKIAHQGEASALQSVVDKYFEIPGKVLDIPCGTGRLLPVLFGRGFEVVGGDISDEMVGSCRKRFKKEPRASFERVNGEEMHFRDNTFDYLTSYRLMCHLPDGVRSRVLREMLRVTRKVVVINYHFETLTPLYVFNGLFRKQFHPPYPLRQNALVRELTSLENVELCEIRKLSWYERSSALVVLRKKGSG